MAWKPIPGTCAICGKDIILNSAKQLYCDDCRIIAKRQNSRDDKVRRRAKKIAEKRGTDPERYKGKETECRYKSSCYYGSHGSCNYMAIEGHSRLRAGYPIEDGKCGAYRRGSKPGNRMKLPAPGGWTYNDMKNV